MSSEKTCLALLLDAPMQAWGHTSRFERRTTALHPTRSGVLGLLAAALGIDKYAPDESTQLARLTPLRITTISLPRHDRRGELPIVRLEDYHTVGPREGIRRASGKVDKDATVQTYRHYLLDARFGVLLEGPTALLAEIGAALRDPCWGVWFGRKCCLPATPLLAAGPAPLAEAWTQLLRRADYTGNEPRELFDHVLESTPRTAGADMIDDAPLGYGRPIGERHAPRWLLRVPRRKPTS
jgi:CRISPR system Cascade subunit CasD